MSTSKRHSNFPPREVPRPTIRPLPTIGAPVSKRTLVFPANDPPATELQPKPAEQEPSSDRAETLRPPALDLALQANGVPEGMLPISRPSPVTPPVVRWTTPNRRPLAPRAVERAARSSERFLQDHLRHAKDAKNAKAEELSSSHLVEDEGASDPLKDERPSDRSTVPTGLFKAVAGRSSANVVELSGADLESDLSLPPPPGTPRDLVPGHVHQPILHRAIVAPPRPAAPARPAAPPPPLGGSSSSADRITIPAPDRTAPLRAMSGPVPPVATERLDTPLVTEPPRHLLPSQPPEASMAYSLSPSRSSAPPMAVPTTNAPSGFTRRRVPRTLVPLVASHVALAGLALFVGLRRPAPEQAAREPRVAVPEWSPLAIPAGTALPSPPAGGCTTSGESRMLAQRAQIGPGLDVAVLDTGFGVGLVSSASEATGLRVEGSRLRVAETVRVRAPSAVSHVTVDESRDEENDGLDVRVDSDEARTVIGAGDGPSFRVVARGGSLLAYPDDAPGRAHTLWALPGAPRSAPALAPNPYTPSGLTRGPVRGATAAAPASGPPVVRVAARDDGGAVVAIRRPAVLWLGLIDAALAPAGPLVPLVRKGATVGTPAVAPWGGGGVVAWSEKASGDREWTVMVAGFTSDGEGGMSVGPVRELGSGISPTVAAMPDGDILLAYAEGPAGAHRVVAVRLTSELTPRGEPLVVSPESVNAGQPVAAVRADGRALVAFFAADRGRSGSVHATPLACDPGL